MTIPRWLSALLIATLLLSSAPASMLAASNAPLPQQQAPSVTSAPSYLLSVTPPNLSVPVGLTGFDVAGYINVQHARHYAEIEARLAHLQEQGAIAGFAPLPSAYAFAISGPTAEAQAALPQMGQLQASGEMSAASVDELAAAYRRQLSAAVDAAIRQVPQAMEPQALPAVLPQAPAAEMQPMAAAAVTTPTFQLQLRENYVSGQSLEASILVTFTLKSASGLVKAEATAISSGGGFVYAYFYDIFGNPAFLAPGDVLEVQAPQLIVIPVVDLRLTPNMATGELTGFAPANITSTDWMTKPYLYLSLAPSGYVTTTAAGTFAVTSAFPLEPGQYWQLTYANADGHLVHLTGQLPILALRGIGSLGSSQYVNDSYVSGAVVTPEALVTITLTHAGNPPVVNFTQSDSDGRFGRYMEDVYGNRVDIHAGDTVEATDGVVTLTVVAPTFTVTSDPVADTVSGTTSATVVTDTVGLTQTLAVWPNSTYSSSYGKSAPGSSFTLGNPFYWYAMPAWGSTTLNWGPGQQGFLHYIDSAGNMVLDDFRATTPAPILFLRGDAFAYAGENWVSGYLDSPYLQCVNGTVALVDAANVVKDQNIVSSCNYGSNETFLTSFFDVFNNPLPILAGDSVVATFDGHTTTVQVPPIALAADSATDVVGGSITPGLVVTDTFGQPQSLAVYASMSTSPWKTVLPDGAGNFSADFSATYNITPGATGFAEYVDAGSNSVYAKWQAPFDKPVLRLRGDSNYVADNYVTVNLPQSSCSNDRPLLLTVKNQAAAVRWQETLRICGYGIGQYLYDAYGNDIDLEAGDIVEATFDGQTASAQVPSFDVQSDAETDTVSGITSATVVTTGVNLTQTLVIWPEWFSYGKYATVTAGAFSVANPFHLNGDPLNGDQTLDWAVGEQGYLRYIDAAGNHVYESFIALHDQPLLTVWKNSNEVSGYTPDGGAPMTVTVKSGATVKAVGYDTSSMSGYFEVDLYDGAGNPVEIESGDEIMVSQPLTSVVVPPLSIVADPDADRISGKGPPNALIEVYVAGLYRTVATDANGDYVLDLRGQMDVEPGDYVRVQYLMPAGHRIYVAAYAGAMLSAALNTDRVWAYAPYEETEITVTVKRGGAVIGSDSTVDYGFVSLFPIDATGKPVILAAGDVLELDFGAGVVKTLTLSSLSLALNVQTEVLSGTGPASSLLGVIADASMYWVDSVMTDAAGAWSANLAAEVVDIRPGDDASVRHSLNGADTTWLFGVAPIFWVYTDTNDVGGYAAPYAPVTVTLKRNGGVLAVANQVASSDGYFWFDLYDVNGLSTRIAAGDVVEVKSAQTVAVTVPVMQITLDAAARIVSGVGPANSRLSVSTAVGNKTVTSDATGAWAVDFSAYTNNPLSWAELDYREPQGNWIIANTVQRVGDAARLQARWDADMGEYSPFAVSGSAGAGPRQVVLNLKRAGGLIATASDWSSATGSFSAEFRNAAGDTVDILAGDVIEMTAGDVGKSMTVPALTVQANLESETLFGTGPANAWLNAGGYTCSGSTTVDPTGAWVLECSSLDVNDDGYVFVTDLMNNSTYLGWSVPFVAVREHGNEVDGTVALGAEVLAQLLRGTAVIAEASDIADSSNGYFYTEFFSAGGSPVIIQPNDVVVVNAGAPITVPVVPLSAVVDTAADRVTGVGPANDQLLVDASGSNSWAERYVTTAADGSYTADFAGAMDLRPGNWLEVTHENAEGNEVWLGWNAPLVRINLASDIVDGFATPNSTASLVLKRGGATIATAQASTSMDGQFSAFFLDGSGNLVDLVADDVVEVTASPTVAAAAIALTASLDTRNDTVSGNSPAGASILVVAYTCSTGGCSRVQMTVIASDAGVYAANFSGMLDLDATSYAYVQAADAAGNQTSITTTPAEVPQLDSTVMSIESNGAVLAMSAYGTANWNNLTPPKSFNVAGGGRLIFSANGGTLVVTAPDGTITRPDSTYYVIENPRTGKWQVQVETWNDLGFQYTVAAGLAQYSIYMPSIKRQ